MLLLTGSKDLTNHDIKSEGDESFGM